MNNADIHENAAMEELAHRDGDTQGALVEAVLALACAVDKLATAHESLVHAVADLASPASGTRARPRSRLRGDG